MAFSKNHIITISRILDHGRLYNSYYTDVHDSTV